MTANRWIRRNGTESIRTKKGSLRYGGRPGSSTANAARFARPGPPPRFGLDFNYGGASLRQGDQFVLDPTALFIDGKMDVKIEARIFGSQKR
jgi:hypothetical protein